MLHHSHVAFMVGDAWLMTGKRAIYFRDYTMKALEVPRYIIIVMYERERTKK